MLDKFYKNKLDRYILENITFRFTTVALILLIIYLIWIIVSKSESEKIVFMPPKMIAQEFWISGDQVSKSYLEEMGQFITYSLLNITKHNAQSNIDNIMPLIEAKFYNDVKVQLVNQNKHIIDNSISRTFFLSAVDSNEKGILKVYGIVKDIIGDKVIKSEQYLVEIGYKIIHGRFWVNSIAVNINNK